MRWLQQYRQSNTNNIDKGDQSPSWAGPEVIVEGSEAVWRANRRGPSCAIADGFICAIESMHMCCPAARHPRTRSHPGSKLSREHPQPKKALMVENCTTQHKLGSNHAEAMAKSPLAMPSAEDGRKK